MADDHDRFEDAAAAYLLCALPDDEAAAFERHLAGCGSCRDEVERLRMAADALPASAVQVAPPPELKDRIMAVVYSEAEMLAAAEARAGESSAQAAGGGPRSRTADGGRARGRGRWSLRPWVAVAGAACALGAGIAVGAGLGGDPGESRTVAADLAPRGADVRMVVRGDGQPMLVAERLPEPGRGRVYQVWLQSGREAPRPTNALFAVRSDGSASVVVPGSLDDVDAVLVTSEPAGGSDAPTRPPILRVET